MEKTNLIFNIINTLIIVTAGLLGYFFIETKYIVEAKSNVELATSEMAVNQAQLGLYLSEKVTKDLEAELAPLNEALELAKKNGEIVLNLSQARLNEVNSELAKVQLDLQKTNAKLDVLSKKSNITLDISKLINDIQPTLKVTCELFKNNIFDFNCTHTNVGSHKVNVSKPILHIYNLTSGKEIPQSKYKIKGAISNVIASGIQGSNRIYITDLDNELSSDFEIVIRWDATLHSTVLNAVQPLLSDLIEDEVLNSLTKQGYTFRYVKRY